MEEYHKIETLFKRDMENKGKIIIGNFTCPEFEYLAYNKWIFTEKVDGTNIRILYNPESIHNSLKFAGKTDNASLPVTLFGKLQEIFDLQKNKFIEKFEKANVCLYGEGYGSKISKGGGNYSNSQNFVLFDVRIDDLWLKRESLEDIASYFGIDLVPVIGSGTLYDMIDLCKSGFNSHWGDFIAEGIVAKPEIELSDRRNKRIITKLKYKDFEH